MMTVVLGLTGPIGCGKSTVAARLASHGAAVIDADAVAREVTAPGQPTHDAILERFGDGVRAADGTLDRAALGRLVFADPALRAELEAITSPAIRPVLLARLQAARAAGSAVVVLEAIRLVEARLAELCDVVVLVTCLRAEQLARVIARGASPEDAERRIAAQAGLVERVRSAVEPVVLDTTGPLERTERLVDELWEQLLAARG